MFVEYCVASGEISYLTATATTTILTIATACMTTTTTITMTTTTTIKLLGILSYFLLDGELSRCIDRGSACAQREATGFAVE